MLLLRYIVCVCVCLKFNYVTFQGFFVTMEINDVKKCGLDKTH